MVRALLKCYSFCPTFDRRSVTHSRYGKGFTEMLLILSHI